MSVWRGTLLFVGFCASAAVLAFLLVINGCFLPMAEKLAGSNEETAFLPDSAESEMIVFPYAISGTSLVVEKYISYSGAYVEDLSFDDVSDIAALVVKNIGSQIIEKAEIVLYIQDTAYRFVATKIPPQRQTLLLEQERREFSRNKIFAIVGTATEEPCRLDGQHGLLVERAGLDKLALTNCAIQSKENIRIYYKATDTTGRYLLGGVTHSFYVPMIKTGETVYIKPEVFAKYNSQIVQMLY